MSPTVRAYGSPKVATAPLSNIRVTTGAPAGAFTPVDIAPAVDIIGQQMERERQKADIAANIATDNQLDDIQQEIELRAKAAKGKDALGATEQARDEWEKRIAEMSVDIPERQRNAFLARASMRGQALHRTTMQHAAAEMDQFTASETQTAIAKRMDAAVTNFADPVQRETALNELAAVTRDRGRVLGQSKEQTDYQVSTLTSKAHASVIQAMLTSATKDGGGDLVAKRYYESVKDALLPAEADEVRRKLEVATTDGEASRTVDGVWSRLGPKSANDPVKLATMEQDLRDHYGDDTKGVRAAIAELRSRVGAHDKEQSEVHASNKAAVLGAFNTGTPLRALLKMPEYLALGGDDQAQIKEHVIATQYTEGQRAESEQTKQSLAEYWKLSNPNTLAGMSENDIIAKQPEIGRALVTQLLESKRTIVKTDSEVRVANIDDDLFKSLAHRAGFKPYAPDSKSSVEDKAALGQLKMTVEAEIDQAQQRVGKRLNTDEKRAIMASVLDRKVMVNEWGRDPEKIIATLTPDERAKAYVPLAKIPAAKVAQLRAMMKANGVQSTDDRIQRAHAAALLGNEAMWKDLTGEKTP